MAYIQSVEEQNTYGNIDLPCEADRKYTLRAECLTRGKEPEA